MFELVVQAHFAAAHKLRGYKGQCEKLHGHNWRVDVYLRGDELDELGMLVDFSEVKKHVNAVLDELDHQYLNDLDAFRVANPTTEHIARHIAEALAPKMPDGVCVHRVTAWETERCGATYWVQA